MPAVSNTRNWRRNPFTTTEYSLYISGETHSGLFFNEFNTQGFILRETPRKDAPSSFDLRTASGVIFTEVQASTAVGPLQYHVDYDDGGVLQYATGFVELNAADADQNFLATYYGKGATVQYNEDVWTGIPGANARIDALSGSVIPAVSGVLSATITTVSGNLGQIKTFQFTTDVNGNIVQSGVQYNGASNISAIYHGLDTAFRIQDVKLYRIISGDPTNGDYVDAYTVFKANNGPAPVWTADSKGSGRTSGVIAWTAVGVTQPFTASSSFRAHITHT